MQWAQSMRVRWLLSRTYRQPKSLTVGRKQLTALPKHIPHRAEQLSPAQPVGEDAHRLGSGGWFCEPLREFAPRDSAHELGQIFDRVLPELFAPLLFNEFARTGDTNEYVVAAYLAACACSIILITWCVVRCT